MIYLQMICLSDVCNVRFKVDVRIKVNVWVRVRIVEGSK